MPTQTDRVFTRALNILTGCPTIKTAPVSVKLQFIIFPLSMSIPHKARERLLLVGGGQFRGMGGDGKSRRGAFAAGFFDRASARLPRRGFGFDSARARANKSTRENFVLRKPRFSIPNRLRASIGMTVFFSAQSKSRTTPRAHYACCHNRHHKRQPRPQRAELSIRKECRKLRLSDEDRQDIKAKITSVVLFPIQSRFSQQRTYHR